MADDDDDYVQPDEQPVEQPDEQPVEPQQVASADDGGDNRDYVTDPNLHQQLDAASSQQDGDREYITSPEMIKQLDAQSQPQQDADREYVTDPELIKQLDKSGLPEAESATGAFTREIAHGVGPAAAAAVAGSFTGGAAGGTIGAFTANPFAIGAGSLVGGLVGGAVAGYGASAAQETGAKAMGFDDDLLRTANAQAHPYATLAGTAVSNIAGFGRGAVGWIGRAASGLISGGGELGSQLYQGKSLEEAALPTAVSTATGAVLAKPYKWGEAAGQIGTKYGSKLGSSITGRSAPVAAPAAEPVPTVAEPVPTVAEPPATTSRSGMPETGGVAKEAVPPPAGDEPSSYARDSKEAPETPAPKEPAPQEPPTQYGQKLDEEYPRALPGTKGEPLVGEPSPPQNGVNVLRPGEVDPAIASVIRARARQEFDPSSGAGTGGTIGQEAAAPEEPRVPVRLGGPRAPVPEQPPAGPMAQRPAAPTPAAAVRPAAPAARASTPDLDAKIAKAVGEAPKAPAAPQDVNADLAKYGLTPKDILTPAKAQETLGRTAAAVKPAETVSEAPAPKVRNIGDQLKAQEAARRAAQTESGFTAKEKEAAQRRMAKGVAASTEPFKVYSNDDASKHYLMRGSKMVSVHDNMGQALIALEQANKAAGIKSKPAPTKVSSTREPPGAGPKARAADQAALEAEVAGGRKFVVPRVPLETPKPTIAEPTRYEGGKLYGDLTPQERAIVDKRSSEREFQQAKKAEPGITREEYDKRRAGNRRTAEAFLRGKLPTEKSEVAPAAEPEGIPDFLRRTPKSQAMAREGEIRRQDIERGRSGRPIKTERLPIGTEKQILEKGYERATGPKDYPKELEDTVSKYMRGEATAAQVQKEFKDRGWTVNLRRRQHEVEAFDPSGRQHYIQGAERKGPAEKQYVETHDGSLFQGSTIHEAAAHAKAAGYKPDQIFQLGGKPYQPPKAAAAPPAGGGKPPPSGKPSRPGWPKDPAPVAATKEDLQRGTWASVQRWLGVRASSTPSGRAARDIYMKAEGRGERERQVGAARFTDKMHRTINEMPSDEQRKLVNWIQGGDHFPGYKPKADVLPIVDQIRATYRDFVDYITSLPKFEQQQFWDNSKYLTGQYKDPTGAQKFYSEYNEGGPRAGGSGSLKQRKFATDEDARAAGLEPASTNPIQRLMWYTDAMSRYISKTKQIEDGKAGGYIKYYGPELVGGSGTPEPGVRNRPPDGWSPLNGVRDQGGRSAYAPTEYAATFNNAYSPGFAKVIPENIVQGARRAINAYTAVELAGPAYHFLNTMHEGLASHWGDAVSLSMAGKPVAAARSVGKGIASPLSGLPSFGGLNPFGKQADRIMDVYLKRAQDVTPQEKAIVDAMEGGNWKPIGVSHTLDYEMSKAGSLLTSALQGSLKAELKNEAEKIYGALKGKDIPAGLAAPFNMIGRVSQTIAHPLFQYYIPRMKATAAYDSIRNWLDTNPHATPEELHEAAVRTLKSIDNRMGEMAHDNMMMNRGARDIMSFLMRSPSFSIGGVVREIGAGTLSIGRGAIKGENRISMASKSYDPRTAYAISFFLATGAITATYQFLKTGKMPSSDDLGNIMLGVAKTGGKVPGVGGKRQVDEEAIMPGYNKDFRGYYHDFWGELKNKQPGLYQRIEEQIANEQWSGPVKKPIVPPKATAGEALAARLKAFGASSLPIMGKQAAQTPYTGSHITYPEQVMGIRSPGTWQTDPKAYQASADKREQAAWDYAIKRENIDRMNRGLLPLPSQPSRPSRRAP